jgi:hypothetical protein
MKFARIFSLGFLIIIFMAAEGYADGNPARELAGNCKVELDTYCKDVTPGRGRILACLNAFSDKLSDTCKASVLEATAQMKALAASISFVKDECAADLQQFCKDVSPGEGRVMKCLDTHGNELSQRCRSALKDVGLGD